MAYNDIFMWDGRAATLEEQALMPITSADEMGLDLETLTAIVNNESEYQQLFAQAYPDEALDPNTISKALAAFQRSLVSNNSPFDHWVLGDADAMTDQQINGFRLFIDENKGNCAACHQGANFTDNGFHNLGFSAQLLERDDVGRYAIKPLRLMKGAFKTPTLRDVALTAPYFHDGRAETLADVMEHYIDGAEQSAALSPNMKTTLVLTESEAADIISFLKALTSPQTVFAPGSTVANLK